MSSKILIISPTATHPTIAGNSARIFAMVELLRLKKYHIDFLLATNDEIDIASNKVYWGDNFHVHTNFTTKQSLDLSQKFLRKLIDLFGKLFSIAYLKYNKLIDYYYPDGLNEYILELYEKNKYDIVIVEYVVLSRAFKCFPRSVKKILDTHDQLGNRYKTYLKRGLTPTWYSLFPQEEFKGLKRADLIIGIQKSETEYFKASVNKKVITTGHILQYNPVRQDQKNVLVFIASDNKINVDAIFYFIYNIFYKLIEVEKQKMQLIIAGSVCNAIDLKNHIPSQIADYVELYGQFNFPIDVYSKASVAINPIKAGTGLKIKLIEALSFGVPVVSFAEGSQGVYSKGKLPVYNAESDNSMINAIIEICTLSNSIVLPYCETFITEYNQKNTSEFLEALS